MTDAEQPLIYQGTDAPVAAMILMHGLGASGEDLFPLAETLAGGRLRVICPHAPVRAVTINGGMQMPAWYDITGADLNARQDAAGVQESAVLIERLLAAEQARGLPAERIFLAGFSQGAALALHVGLRYQHRLAGLIALSGYLLFADDVGAFSAVNRETPIFQAHGNLDPVVLPAWGRSSRDILVQQGYSPTYREYPMAHAIVPQELDDINEWLAHRLTDWRQDAAHGNPSSNHKKGEQP